MQWVLYPSEFSYPRNLFGGLGCMAVGVLSAAAGLVLLLLRLGLLEQIQLAFFPFIWRAQGIQWDY